jgi:hypothetical protein
MSAGMSVDGACAIAIRAEELELKTSAGELGRRQLQLTYGVAWLELKLGG